METVTRIPVPIPFHTQCVTPENFASEGYATLEEGESWTCRSCGIASVRMVIDGLRALRGQEPCPCQAEMLRRGLTLGAYKPGVGWIHQGLADLAAEYGVTGTALRGQTPEDIRAFLAAGRPCIASVSPRFAGGEPEETGTPIPRGGHLVVLLGYAEEDGALTGYFVHHPSCFPEYSWPDCSVDAERFNASFSGNCIVFDSNGTGTMKGACSP